MFVRLDSAPRAADLLVQLQSQEAGRQVRLVPFQKVALTGEGLLSAGGEEYPYSDEARKDLAALARIPETYFAEIDPDLRAINFNRRLMRHAIGDDLSIVWNGNTVSRVRRQRLIEPSRAHAVEVILEEASADTVPNDIRAVVYALNGHVDVSFVSRARATEPRVGDIVCGGVHLTIEASGAVQIGAATFRLACANGAFTRVCSGGRHRIRRGAEGGEEKLTAALRHFAREAWGAWGQLESGFRRLADTTVHADGVGTLLQRLRQSPFFLSVRAASLVRQELQAAGQGDVTLYDLHNAITAIGSHNDGVLERYRYRLRLGAGALARGNVGVCRECRQLVLQ